MLVASGRSKSWIVRQALGEWLAEEQRRYQLTLEALQSVDEGRLISHEEILERVSERKDEPDWHRLKCRAGLARRGFLPFPHERGPSPRRTPPPAAK